MNFRFYLISVVLGWSMLSFWSFQKLISTTYISIRYSLVHIPRKKLNVLESSWRKYFLPFLFIDEILKCYKKDFLKVLVIPTPSYLKVFSFLLVLLLLDDFISTLNILSVLCLEGKKMAWKKHAKSGTFIPSGKLFFYALADLPFQPR